YLIDSGYWRGGAVLSSPPAFSLQDRIEAVIDLHQALTALHENDLVYGDLSANNVCFPRGPRPPVFILAAERTGPGATPVVTPDWDVPVEAPVDRDRARFALLAWRLLAERPTVRPSGGLSTAPPGLQAALTSCYCQGSADTFAAVAAELHAALEPERRQA